MTKMIMYKSVFGMFKAIKPLSHFANMNTKHNQDALEALKYFRKKKGQMQVITMNEMRERMQKRLIYKSWLDRQSRQSKMESLPENSCTEIRNSVDSFSAMTIPLSTDERLREKCISFLEHVRPGRLLEHLDSFAVWVASNHICNSKDEPLKINLVTVLVDAVEFIESNLSSQKDIRLSGYVSWCSRSTIETELFMEQEDDNDEWKLKTTARFLMAARDPQTGKAKCINQLKPDNNYEESLIAKAKERRQKKRTESVKNIYTLGPNAEESEILHNLMYSSIEDPESFPFHPSQYQKDVKLIENARLSTTRFSHPEVRNFYGTVFGGYLMQLASELSWSCVFYHSKQFPHLIAIGDIKFHRPVPISSLLRATSFIVYTEGNLVVTTVILYVHEPSTGAEFRTNDFHFVYRIDKPEFKVVPRSYAHGLMYLDGRRFLLNMRS